MIMIKAACASFLLLLVACSEFPHVQSAEDMPVVERGGGTSSNLEEINAASTMTVLQQERLLADMERDYRVKPDADNRLRLALLLIIGNEPLQDHERARALIEGIDASTRLSPSQQGLVVLLSQFFEGQEVLLGQLEVCTSLVTQQDRRINELEQQQKELTSIEQNIQHRDKPAEVDDDR